MEINITKKPILIDLEIDYILKLLVLNRKNIYFPEDKNGTNTIRSAAQGEIIKKILDDTKLDPDLQMKAIIFIKILFSIIRYITFNEFFEKIKLISLEIIKLLENEIYTTFYFVASGQINKSNTWVIY